MPMWGARWMVGVFVFLLGACATPPQTQLLKIEAPLSLPRHAELTQVPFFAQKEYQCGPASLAMVLHAAGIAMTPEALKDEVYIPDRLGSLQIEMLAAPRRHGSVAYQLAPNLPDLFAEIAGGIPVVVLQNLSVSWYPVWHYAVVVGYDLDKGEVIMRSGQEQRQVLPMSTFEYTWARSGYWAMVATAPGKIPVTAEENTFIAVITALEKSGDLESANSAYTAASKRWPGNLAALIGAGNTAYRMKRWIQAESAFRQATIDHPDSVAAFNNLAQTLADQGRYPEALEFANKAVSLAGPMLPTSQATLNDIKLRMK